MDYELNADLNELLDIYRLKHGDNKEKFIVKAFDFADKKHARMKRGTGEPFINHPLRVAKMLAEWGFDSDVIAAALLHDVTEQEGYPVNKISSAFGEEVGKIISSASEVSDKAFIAKRSRIPARVLSGEFPENKIYDKSLYLKIADRIDNLSTVEGIDESAGIKMANHTKNIFVPMVREANAYHFADILEDLCFRTEHPKMYEEIRSQYELLLEENGKKCRETLAVFEEVFSPFRRIETDELSPYRRYMASFRYDTRSTISLYRQISSSTDNIKRNWRMCLTKANTPLYELTVIVRDELAEGHGSISPKDLFFICFDKVLSKRGFYLRDHGFTIHGNSEYYLISDDTDDLFRLFVRTDKDFQRYSYGDIVDKDNSLFRDDNDDPEPYGDKIKVFTGDGTPLFIKNGATVLDLAFLIDPDSGLHFDHAMVNESKTRLEKYTVLNEGDIVTIFTDDKIKPDITWFEYLRTGKAIHCLVDYFSKKTGSRKLR
ncbi:MAG: HD domain-containing protein [Saccharofermentans sp.]|nr:HD domain-containing protein [Saccharofermentans sp.]